MTDDIFTQISNAIKNRATWETRMDTMYKARFTGLPRGQRPYPNAPDMRYPLIDTVIEKLRPFYAQQVYSDLVLATFVCDNSLAREQIVNCEQWFDYQLKQNSDFEPAIMKGIDYMLNYGFCPIKVYWDVKEKHVCFDPVDPLYIIVPQWTEDDPDWLVHVMSLSVAQYKKKDYYDQAKLDVIKGRGAGTGISVARQKEQDKADREGLTYAPDDNTIILWEVYTRDGDNWSVETVAPARGFEDGVVRKAYGLPYKHGELPFPVIRYDNSQKGWYASRGIAEVLVLHQQSLNKNWNSQLQFLDFFGHPQYKNTGLTPINPGNFQSAPGRILPPGVEPVASPSVPMDFQSQMQFVRALAEDRIVIPDLSSGEHLVGPRSQSGKITATQVNAIVGLSNQSNDLRSRMFRMQLGKIYNQAWSLLKQFAGNQVNFIFENSTNKLDPLLFNYNYNIVPSGSADSWNKQQRIMQSSQVFQLLKGDPNVDALELDKWFLEAQDPRLVNRLIKDAGTQAMKQAEKQAVETTVMLNGRPMSVNPSDDDPAHIQDLMGTFQRRMQTHEPITPEFSNIALTHANEHVNAMKSKKHPQANQYAKQLAQVAKTFQQAMAQHQQMGGGMPQQGGMPQMGQPSGSNGQKSPSEQINYKDAPPSIRRQMEAQAGMRPALPEESALEVAAKMPKGAQGAGSNGSVDQAGADQANMSQAAPQSSQPMPAISLNVPPVQFDMAQLSQAIAQAMTSHPPPQITVQSPEPMDMKQLAKVLGEIISSQPPPQVIVKAPAAAPPTVNFREAAKKSEKKTITIKRNKEGDITGAEVEAK